MPMTIRQIMSSTPPSRRHAADYVKVTQLKVRRSPDGNPMVLAKTIASHTSDGIRKSPQPMHKYVTTLEILGKHVRCSCSCDDFWSTWEYALAKRGAANSEYSNGEPPVVRNPKFVPGCCKHIFRLSELLIEQGKL